MGLFRARWWALAGALGVTAASAPAGAISTTEARARADRSIRTAESGVQRLRVPKSVPRTTPTPAQRIVAGDLLLRTKDYERAIDELSKIVELYRQGKMQEDSHAEALFLLANAYFQDEQLLAARRHYRDLLERVKRRPYQAYAGRTLSRLVDIALRTDDLESLDEVFARLNDLPVSDATGSIQYARAKLLFVRGEYAAAKASVNGLPSGSEYEHQAQYLLGVILTKEATPLVVADREAAAADVATAALPRARSAARYAVAVEQFRKVTRLPARTSQERHVVDLSWMAIGRLFYESDNYLDAADAYAHVDRKSPEFSAMLFELAWVYVRLGDYQRGQRALEVLSITDPQSLDLADGSLLRADLMLRLGQFDKALTMYRSVRSQFDPIREQVDRFLNTTTDPAVYYDRLTIEEEAQGDDALPPMVLDWARDQALDTRAFSIIDDVTRSRSLIRRARQLAMRLNAVLSVSARVRAFPELLAAMEATVGLQNRVALGRLTLAEGMDDAADDAGGELGQVRRERQSLMRRLGYLPVRPSDFVKREDAGQRQWNQISQELQQLTLEADKLHAIVNGLERLMREADQHGVTVDPMSRERFRVEIDANARDLEGYQARIQQYRDALEMGRVQIGFGDRRFVEDDQVRERFKQVFQREVALEAAGQGSRDGSDYARSIQGLLSRADQVETQLERFRSGVERDTLEQARVLQSQVAEEASLLSQYAENLDVLDHQARLLVGEVAMQHFGLVRDRLKSIVLRADVGIVQQGWEVREEQRVRVRNLQRERAREEQTLNDELREVLDDAEEQP